MAKKIVWVLTIEHRHGRDITVFERKTAAEQTLHDYVVSWWLKDLGDEEPIPEDPEKAIEAYFNQMQDESWDLNDCEVEDGMPPDPAPKERKRTIPLCAECGSSEVLFDAYATWDTDQQKYDLHQEFDQAYCEGKCNGECHVEWKELTPELQAKIDAEDES